MITHGTQKTNVHKFSNGTIAIKVVRWCAPHALWVDSEQWKAHEDCPEREDADGRERRKAA